MAPARHSPVQSLLTERASAFANAGDEADICQIGRLLRTLSRHPEPSVWPGLLLQPTVAESFADRSVHPAMLVDLTRARLSERQCVVAGCLHASPLLRHCVKPSGLFVQPLSVLL
jgi:hypothetical protein